MVSIYLMGIEGYGPLIRVVERGPYETVRTVRFEECMQCSSMLENQ